VLRAGTRSFCSFARLRNFAVERRQATLLLGQEALLQQLADDALDRFRQAAFAFAAAGSAQEPVRDQPSTLPGTADQDVDLPPDRPSAELPHRRLHARPLRRCQRPDDFRPTPGTRPCLIGQGGHALLGNR
jgi:hypothetical protein